MTTLVLGLCATGAGLWRARADYTHADYDEQWRVEIGDRVAFAEFDSQWLVLRMVADVPGNDLMFLSPDTGAIVRRIVTVPDNDEYNDRNGVILRDGELLLSTRSSDELGPGLILWRSEGAGWVEIARRAGGPEDFALFVWTSRGGVLVGDHATSTDSHEARALPLDDAGAPIGEAVTLFAGQLFASAAVDADFIAFGNRYDEVTGDWAPNMGRFGTDGSSRWQQRWPKRMWLGHTSSKPVYKIVVVDGLVCLHEGSDRPLRCVDATDGSLRWELPLAGQAVGSDGARLLVVSIDEQARIVVSRYSTSGEKIDHARVISASDAAAHRSLSVLGVGSDRSVYVTDSETKDVYWRFSPKR